ncbi:hypothetical protein [Nocardioides korecus]
MMASMFGGNTLKAAGEPEAKSSTVVPAANFGSGTLLKGDLTGIVKARQLSRATMSNICQSLVFAFIYSAVGIPIAAGVLYPVFG